MTDTPRFQGRAGGDPSFFEPYPIGHFVVEAPIEAVCAVLEEAAELFRLHDAQSLAIERDVFGKPLGNERPLVPVFQLAGQDWTQVAADLRRLRDWPLARRLSRSLDTRCLFVAVTDDAYATHAILDRGEARELHLEATLADVDHALQALDLEVPADLDTVGMDEMDTFEEADYSWRSDGSPARDLEAIAAELGVYLQAPLGREDTHGISDLAADDLVRMDVGWSR